MLNVSAVSRWDLGDIDTPGPASYDVVFRLITQQHTPLDASLAHGIRQYNPPRLSTGRGTHGYLVNSPPRPTCSM